MIIETKELDNSLLRLGNRKHSMCTCITISVIIVYSVMLSQCGNKLGGRAERLEKC